jgi:hypothetical protein
MLKKIFLGILLVGLIAVLLFGAACRTNAITAKGSGSQEGTSSLFGIFSSGGQSSSSNFQGGGGNNRGGGGSGRVSQQGGTGSQSSSNVDQGTGNSTAASELGSTQASTREWITIEGAVSSLTPDVLTVTSDQGVVYEIANRAWRFAQEQGFTTSPDNRLSILGFFDENNVFEACQITDLTTGERVTLRDENGRPLWAGRGGSG